MTSWFFLYHSLVTKVLSARDDDNVTESESFIREMHFTIVKGVKWTPLSTLQIVVAYSTPQFSIMYHHIVVYQVQCTM